MSNFNKVGLIAKSNDLSVSETLNKVYNLLQSKGLDVMLDNSTRGLLGGPITVDMKKSARSAIWQWLLAETAHCCTQPANW